MTKEVEQELNRLYEDAKKCPVKGRMYIYEQYKRQVGELNLDPYEYTEACRTLANNLEV